MQRKVFIYLLVDPRDDAIRYVGKSISPKRRLIDHVASAKAGRKNTHTVNWLAGVVKDGLHPRMELIDYGWEDDWEDKEIFYIAHYKARGCRLTNDTGGGEGGRRMSEAHRQKIAEAGRGRRHSEETKEKMRTWNIGRKMSDEARANMSKAKKGGERTLEWRLNNGEKLGGRGTSGVRGVTWHKREKKWQVSFMFKGRTKFFGNFSTLEEATNKASWVAENYSVLFNQQVFP